MVQTWVLKVSIHCEGCKKKVKKVLQKVEGVYSIDIDSKQNRVTVTGNVDAESLIRRLLKYGKHSELLQDKNHTTANSSSSSSATAAAAAIAEATGEKEPTTVLETEQDQHAEQGKPVVAAKSLVETTSSDEATAPKPDSDAPSNRGGDKSSQLEKNSSEKPAGADTEGKKNGKGGQREESREDENADYDSGRIPSPPPSNPFMKPQPVYTMSYSTIHPSTSYAYYEAPPAMPSSYGYSEYPPPLDYVPEYYSSESYYGSMEPAAPSSGSYDMFSEENPNACHLM